MGRLAKIAALAGTLAISVASHATAQSANVVGPYDGEIPFNCELQNVGTGTDFPEPHADPFCVEFDKTNQNVTDFGLADFTAQEPARVAAAGDKCFYFQRDHWTGSIVQGQSPEVWHWDGNYFYDRARGVGGVSVRDFRLGGTPQSASPYVPPAYAPYFDENGGGGVEVLLESDPDPTCAVKVDTPAERDQVYGDRAAELQCIEPGGGIHGQRVGRAKLGLGLDKTRTRLGPPTYSKKHIDAWCLSGKGELRIAYGKHGSRAILTSGSGQTLHGVSRGDRVSRARRLLDLGQRQTARGGAHYFTVGSTGRRNFLIGITHRRVRWLMTYSSLDARTAQHLIRHVP